MRMIEIDEDVWKLLQQHAVPFVDTPNDVLRRLLGINIPIKEVNDKQKQNNKEERTTNSREAELKNYKEQTDFVDPAFLTFLIYKFHKKMPQGTSFIAAIEEFMSKMHLKPGSKYWNPWMINPYEDWDSCKNTISHFRECRRFGCWNGMDIKNGCTNFSCKYHPENTVKIKNKCELNNGVIWQKESPNSEYKLGAKYLEVIKSQLLSGRKIPINSFISIFYPDKNYTGFSTDRIQEDFNLTTNEIEATFEFD